MFHHISIALALVVGTPVVAIPVPADAQVMVGMGARSSAPRPRPLSDREYEQLTQAENDLQEAETRMAEIREASEAAGGMTPEQHAEMQTLQRKRDQASRIVERLSRRL